MAVLIFHSYLLRGTGSNVYNAELAKCLARLGHDVHIFCQDREADRLEWVDAVGRWGPEGLSVTGLTRPGPGRGRGEVTAYVPEINGLLPVFVEDRYRGFRVKTFPDMTEAEIERYLESNVAAVAEVAERSGRFEACLANHLIMAPCILARAGLEFAIKVHGSDLSYAVVPHPERFVPYAREGIDAARGILVGSAHTAEQLRLAVPSPDLIERTRLGPPGLDPGRFRSGRRSEAVTALGSHAGKAVGEPAEGPFGRHPLDAAAGLEWFAAAEGPRVIYVGKLLINKGVDLLLAAWPLVHAANPGARLLLAGFGQFRQGLEQLWAALAAGDLAAASELADSAVEEGAAGSPRQLSLLNRFLAGAPSRYAEDCRAAAGSVRITGRLEHAEVADAMAAADLLYMPSTFPEAFGMVVAEAAASGTFPISAAHSGMLEVTEELAEAVGPEWAGCLSFELDADPISEMAEKGRQWLSAGFGERREVEAGMANLAAARWGWERVSADVIAASNGDLKRLRTPRRTFRKLQ